MQRFFLLITNNDFKLLNKKVTIAPTSAAKTHPNQFCLKEFHFFDIDAQTLLYNLATKINKNGEPIRLSEMGSINNSLTNCPNYL